MNTLDIGSYVTNFDLDHKDAESVASWFHIERATIRGDHASEVAGWMVAQGWNVYGSGPEWSHINTATGITEYIDVYYLERTFLSAFNALDELVGEYTTAYNEGRTINNQRYDDLIALWTGTLSNTEAVLSALQSDEDTFETLMEVIIGNLSSDYTTFSSAINTKLDAWDTAEQTRIADDFTAKTSAARNEQINTGWFTSSIWSTMNTGIEGEKQKVLNDLAAKKERLEIDLDTNVYQLKVDMRKNMLTARERLIVKLQGLQNERLEIRNGIVVAMAGIIERRTDSYPDIDKIGEMVAKLGVG